MDSFSWSSHLSYIIRKNVVGIDCGISSGCRVLRIPIRPPPPASDDFHLFLEGGAKKSLVRSLMLPTKVVKVLEIAVGACLAPTRLSLVRSSGGCMLILEDASVLGAPCATKRVFKRERYFHAKRHEQFKHSRENGSFSRFEPLGSVYIMNHHHKEGIPPPHHKTLHATALYECSFYRNHFSTCNFLKKS